VYGARPLKRFIQREVETRIGRALLGDEIAGGATILLDADGDKLAVTWAQPGAEEDAGPGGDASAAAPMGAAA
jgi:ATP-dependent Clp protease ATP-binding subunit ClpB